MGESSVLCSQSSDFLPTHLSETISQTKHLPYYYLCSTSKIMIKSMRVSIFIIFFAAIATETVGAQGIFRGRNNGNHVRALVEEVSMSADLSLSLPFGEILKEHALAPEPSGKSGKRSSMMSMGKSGKGGWMMSMGKSGKGGSMMSMGKSSKGGSKMSTGKSGKGGNRPICLKAMIGPINVTENPDAKGTVSVCFNGQLSSPTGARLKYSVTGFKIRPQDYGGVHIHSGVSCLNTTTQGGHFYKFCEPGGPTNPNNCPGPYLTNANVMTPPYGDPWFNSPSAIAPTGTGYNVTADGKSNGAFLFDQGYGYAATVGKVVIFHVGSNATQNYTSRIACGVLM